MNRLPARVRIPLKWSVFAAVVLLVLYPRLDRLPRTLARYADPGYFQFSQPLQTAAVVVDRILESVGPGWGRLYLTVTAAKDGE